MEVSRAHIHSEAGSPAHPAYSREEVLLDAAVHAAGICGGLIALPVLITLAAVWYGDAPVVRAAIIYGVGFIAMFALSASYHMSRHPRRKTWLRRLDHAAIYVKIAATYTPFAVLVAGAEATVILACIWTAALVGVSVKLISARRWEWTALGLYFAMGWAILLVGRPILAGVAPATFALMIAGGVIYSIGVVFLYLPRLRYHNAIWHAHVLAASFIFYAALLVEVTRHAPVP